MWRKKKKSRRRKTMPFIQSKHHANNARFVSGHTGGESIKACLSAMTSTFRTALSVGTSEMANGVLTGSAFDLI